MNGYSSKTLKTHMMIMTFRISLKIKMKHIDRNRLVPDV